jgi:uncharacterized protein
VSGNGSDLLVRTVRGKGRGLFAGRRFLEDEVIERAPVIIVPNEQFDFLAETVVSSYCFSWGKNDDAAIPLGLCSLLNHSYTPNAYAQLRVRDRVIEFLALRQIEEGEEITLNYNGDPDNRTPLDFPVRR